MDELFDLVDRDDRVVGTARREEVHGNPGLIHRVAHVLVFDGPRRIYLQKRGMSKDVQPGKWDTSVGGHVHSGERYAEAAVREMEEELGIIGPIPDFLYRYLHENDYETEFVASFRVEWTGPFRIQKSEIDEGRFWDFAEIAERREEGIFTPQFLDELDRYRRFRSASPGRLPRPGQDPPG